METKLRQLMKHEGINSTRLAEILGIQASGISHIMSGRNKPSYDFLHKLLQRFPQLSADWLLLDKGPMYRDEVKNKTATSARPTPAGAAPVSENAGSVEGFGSSGDARGLWGSGGSGVPGRPVDAGSYGGAKGTLGPDAAVSGGVAKSAGSGSFGGVSAQIGSGRALAGLFGPDNDDIIPSGGAYAGRSDDNRGRLGDNRGDTGGDRGGGIGNRGYTAESVGHSDAQVRAQTWQSEALQRTQAWQAGPQTDFHTAPPPSVGTRDERRAAPMPYPPDNFTRSASIERIVVFYKDKTFSEYQPE